MPKLANPGRHWFRIQIAIGCGILGLCLLIIAYRVHTQPYLFGEALGTQPRSYAKLWFDSRDALFGANLNGGVLEVERLSPKGPSERWTFSTGESANAFTTSEDGTLAAWLDHDAIAWQVRESSAPERAAVDGAHVLAISVLSDRSVAAVLANGTVRRWSGDRIDDQRINPTPILQAATVGDYLAVGTSESLSLFRYRDGRWTSTETIAIPPGEYRPLIPAPGMMATVQGGLLRYGGEPRNTHGPVLSVGSHRGVILTTGAFERVWAVFGETDDHEDYDVVPAAPGSIVAVGGQRLATSGPQGTALWQLHSEQRLSITGRKVAWGALLSFIGSVLSVLGPFLLKGIVKLFAFFLGKRKKNRKSSDHALLAPSPALIDVLNQGKTVLWAGAGLSAQAGAADRKTFAGALLAVAQTENCITPDEAAALQKLLSRGETEAAVDRIAKRADGKMAPILQSMVPKYLALSRSHELIAALPFSAGVTTNYDDLLERMQVMWPANLRVPQSPGLDRTHGVPFLLKLYGDLRQPATLAYARPQLAAAFPPDARLLLEQAGSQGSFVFLGCSLEGLLADLDALKLEAIRTSRHFAVVGTSNRDWKKIADELQGRFGVEVSACIEDKIAEELPRFLDQVVRATASVQGRRPAALQEDPATV